MEGLAVMRAEVVVFLGFMRGVPSGYAVGPWDGAEIRHCFSALSLAIMRACSEVSCPSEYAGPAPSGYA